MTADSSPKRAPPPEGSKAVKLSARQLECLTLGAAGKTSAEIAGILGLSTRTVDHYFEDACKRLGVRNRVQAVAKALSLGLITP